MNIGPAHVAGAFAAGAAATAIPTIVTGFHGEDGDISPWGFAPAAVGVTGLTGGMIFGSRFAQTNPMLGAATFAAGLGAAGGFMFSLPVAVGIAQGRG